MNQGFEQTIERFEREFIAGKSPEIEQFARGSAEGLLPELVHTELELRLTAGQAARVEGYTNRFPSLARNQETVRELVLTEYNVRRNFDPSCRLEEYLLRFPQLKEMLVEDFLNSSIGESPDDANTQVPTIRQDSHSDIAARFHKRNLHEQGGLGNVWLAHDTELDRQVAVKEIKAKFANSSSHRNRFNREAGITGRLEHPGIVPVYGQGQSGSGSPFFAMQFVRGQNLRSRIKSFHANDCDPDDRSLEFNRMIQHFIDVCNTVEFAHSQGVIHRDIKPENIMIGQYGETFLIDWGLAFLQRDWQNVDQKKDLNDDSKQGLEVDQFASRDGQTIGSPAFMSPEQAAGDKLATGVTSDVYSLGATLFALVTNSANPNQDLEGQPNRRMLRFRKQVSKELTPLLSICDRAMSAAPLDRYASVQNLREDVENFLLDKPVMAHPDSAIEQGSRFLRRNRRVLNTALLSLLLISILSGLGAVWINFERNKAIAASAAESQLRSQAESMQRQETQARSRAEQRTNQLTKIIGFFAAALTGEDDAELNLNPGELTADSIVENLKRRIDEDGDLLGQALVKAVVARREKVAGRYGDAVEHYEGSIELLKQEGIRETDPLHTELLSGLASTYLAEGRMREAEETVAKIKEAYELNPEALEGTYFLTLIIEAELASRQLKNQHALRIATEAVDIGNRIYADSPAKSNLIWARYVLASAHRRADQLDEAIQLFEEIIAGQRPGMERLPLEIAAAVQLSELRLSDSPKEAIELMEQASIQAVGTYGAEHRDAIVIQARLGRLLARQDEPDMKQRGIELLGQCRKRQIESLKSSAHDEVLGTTLLLTKSLNDVGSNESCNRSIEMLTEAIDALSQLEEPSQRKLAFKAAFYEHLAVAHGQLGNDSKAMQAYDDAVELATGKFGTDSAITKQLIEKRQKRKAGK